MSDDRSLTEFTGDGSDAAAENDVEGADADNNAESAASDVDTDTESTAGDVDNDTAATDDAGEAIDPSDVDTATITYRVQPAGADCSRCGETTQRQWVEDGEFVCADCKEW